jgi:hypothetical protein
VGQNVVPLIEAVVVKVVLELTGNVIPFPLAREESKVVSLVKLPMGLATGLGSVKLVIEAKDPLMREEATKTLLINMSKFVYWL